MAPATATAVPPEQTPAPTRTAPTPTSGRSAETAVPVLPTKSVGVKPPANPTPPALPTPAAQSGNLFATILHPQGTRGSLPDGWMVQPCQGDAPVLCVLEQQAAVGTVELYRYPIDTLPDFQELLADAGIQAGSLDLAGPADRAGLLAALQAFVAEYHVGFEADRQVEYGSQIRYTRLPTSNVMLGALPGLQYGFAGLASDGTTYERWVSHVAFDGDQLYVLVAYYRPGAAGTFRDDATLQRFLPYLPGILAGLKLPIPVQDVHQ